MEKILIISGSFRKDSFNNTLAKAAYDYLQDKAEVSFLDYKSLAPFDFDNAYPFDAEATACREQIKNADGLWIFCPEYNGSYPGVLKNLLDYASLPYKKFIYLSGTPLKDKPVTSSGCAGKSAAKRAQAKLDELLTACGCKVMTEPETQVSLSNITIAMQKWSVPQNVKDELARQADAFLEFVRKNS